MHVVNCIVVFCPKCKAEYRSGFTHCADCDVDLVDEIPPEEFQAEEPFRVIWKDDSEKECVDVCKELQKASIIYRVAQIPESRDIRMAVNRRYEVAVPSRDYERARKFLGIESESTESTEGEFGEVKTKRDQYAHESLDPLSAVGAGSYFKEWYPEDASVEIWTQTATDNISSMLELALKENFIRFREQQQEGSRKFFVLPEDEHRAREIVREIEESTPLR